MNLLRRLFNQGNNQETTTAVQKREQQPRDIHEELLISLANKYKRCIGMVYAQKGVPASNPVIKIAPRYVSVGLMLPRVATDLRWAKHPDTADAIGLAAGLGDGSSSAPVIPVYLGNRLYYEFRLPETVWVRGREVRLWRDVTLYDVNDGAIGATAGGVPVRFKFHTSAPHTLVSGATGSGKTELMKTIVFRLLQENDPSELKIAFIDPMGAFRDFRDSPNCLWLPAHSPEEYDAVIRHFYAEFERRRSSLANQEENQSWPKWVLVIDEADDPYVLGEHVEDHQNLLKMMTSKGRSLDINIILGVQTPKKGSLGGALENLANRFHGATANARESGFIEGNLELHKFAGKGDFLHVVGSSQQRFQVALVTPGLIKTLPKYAGTKNVLEVDPPEPPAEYAPADALRKHKGRPSNTVDGKYVAYMVWHRDHTGGLPSANELEERFGFSQYKTTQYRKWLEEYDKHYEYMEGNDGVWVEIS